MFEKLQKKLTESLVEDNERKEKLRRIFPERLVIERFPRVHIETRLADMTGIYAKGGMGPGQPTEDGYSVGSCWFAASRGFVRVVPAGLSYELEKLDEEYRKLSARRKEILRKAYKSGAPLDFSRAQQVVEYRRKLRKA